MIINNRSTVSIGCKYVTTWVNLIFKNVHYSRLYVRFSMYPSSDTNTRLVAHFWHLKKYIGDHILTKCIKIIIAMILLNHKVNSFELEISNRYLLRTFISKWLIAVFILMINDRNEAKWTIFKERLNFSIEFWFNRISDNLSKLLQYQLLYCQLIYETYI